MLFPKLPVKQVNLTFNLNPILGSTLSATKFAAEPVLYAP